MSNIKSEELGGSNGTTDIEPAHGQHRELNAWSTPGPAAFDFRSIPPTPFMNIPGRHTKTAFQVM
jgi:hypothetical protein